MSMEELHWRHKDRGSRRMRSMGFYRDKLGVLRNGNGRDVDGVGVWEKGLRGGTWVGG